MTKCCAQGRSTRLARPWPTLPRSVCRAHSVSGALGRAGRRHHHRLGDLPIAGGHRAEGARTRRSCWAVGRRRSDHAVRRAVACGARGGHAGNRRLLRLSARGVGTAGRISVWLVGAGADPRVGARRHRRRLRRIPAAQLGIDRSRITWPRGHCPRRPSPLPPAATSSAPTSAPPSSASRQRRSFALVLLVGARFMLGGNHGASMANLTARGAGRHRQPGACAGQRALGLRRCGPTCRSQAARSRIRSGSCLAPSSRARSRSSVIYVLANVAYLYVLPIEAIAPVIRWSPPTR